MTVTKFFHVVCYTESQFSTVIEAEDYEAARALAEKFAFTDDHWEWTEKKSVEVRDEYTREEAIRDGLIAGDKP